MKKLVVYVKDHPVNGRKKGDIFGIHDDDYTHTDLSDGWADKFDIPDYVDKDYIKALVVQKEKWVDDYGNETTSDPHNPSYTHYKVGDIQVTEDSDKKQADIKDNARKNTKNKGSKARAISSDILDYVAGCNEENGLSSTDIDNMESEFSEIFHLLKSMRPYTARQLIKDIDVSTTDYVTQGMKDDIEVIFKEHGIE